MKFFLFIRGTVCSAVVAVAVYFTLAFTGAIPTWPAWFLISSAILVGVFAGVLGMLAVRRSFAVSALVTALGTIGLTLLLMGPRIKIYFDTPGAWYHLLLHCVHWGLAGFAASLGRFDISRHTDKPERVSR